MANKRSRHTEPVRGKHAAHAAPSQKVPASPGRTQAAPAAAKDAQAAPRRTGTPSSTDHLQRSTQPSRSGKLPKLDKPRKKRRIPVAVKVVLALVLVVGLGIGSYLTWDYLFRYDDAKDMQGQWKIEGTNSSIVITDSEIRLTDAVSFGYELNTFEKTITYRYANFEGKGSYVFSPERDSLTFTDVSMNEEASADGGDAGASMRLLKVSNQAVGEPETADNNDTADANSTGSKVVSGEESARQAQGSSDATGPSQG